MAADYPLVPTRSEFVTALETYWPQLSIAAVLLVAALVRLYGLTADGLWVDEVATIVGWTPDPTTTIEAIAAGRVPESPLYVLLVQGWLGVFGSTATAARAFSVCCGIASIYLLYATGRALFDHRVGILAALGLALSPLHVQYSREARLLALLFLCSTLSFYCFARLFAGDRSRRVLTGYVVSCVLLVCVHVTGLFVVLAQNVVVARWILPQGWPDRISSRLWLASQTSIVAGSLPWLATFGWHAYAGNVDPFAWFTPPSVGQLGQALLAYAGALVTYPFAVHDAVSYALSLVVLGCVVVLGAYSFVTYTPENAPEWHRSAPSTDDETGSERGAAATRLERLTGTNPDDRSVKTYLQREYVLLCWILVPLLGPYVLSHLFVPVFHLEYAVVSLGGLSLLAAHGLTRLDRDALRWLFAALLLVGLLGSTVVYADAETQEDWPGAAGAIDEEPNETVFVTPDYTADALTVYADRPPETVLEPPDDAVAEAEDPFEPPDETVNETAAALADAPGDDERFWVVAPRTYEHDDEWITDLEAAASVLESHRYGEIDVYRFDIEDDGDDTEGDGDDTEGDGDDTEGDDDDTEEE